MGFKDLISKVGSSMAGSREDDGPEIPDDQTRDKFLRSLRRQRRVQLEENEKKRLQEQIKSFEQKRTREHLYGVKGPMPTKKKAPIKKAVNMLKGDVKYKEKSSYFVKSGLKKTKSKKNTMLSKGSLI